MMFESPALGGISHLIILIKGAQQACRSRDNPPRILADYRTSDGIFKPHLDNTGDDARVIGGLNRHPANLLYAGCSQHVHELLF